MDSRQAITERLYQSIAAARYISPQLTGTSVMSALQTGFGLAPALADLCAQYSTRELAAVRTFIAGVRQVACEQTRTCGSATGTQRLGAASRASRPNRALHPT